jgi:CheY-like chemotaxis protein
MPIADGYASTAMIRDFEAKLRANVPDDEAGGHVPIFAVSASLLESEKDRYIQAGFNGWVMKPINFARLDVLFGGVVDSNNKREARYIPGQWELGGWFD